MRSCVSMLALVGFVASQLAAFPHAQAAAMHDSERPHVHLGAHSHEHSHGGGHIHVHRHSKSKQLRPVQSLVTTDHDSDAVYLPPTGPLKCQEGRAVYDLLFQLAIHYTVAQQSVNCIGPAAVRALDGSEFLPDGRHLFLELGSLRI